MAIYLGGTLQGNTREHPSGVLGEHPVSIGDTGFPPCQGNRQGAGMTRAELTFIAVISICGLVMWVMSYYVRSWLDYSRKPLKPTNQLMKELERYSGKDE